MFGKKRVATHKKIIGLRDIVTTKDKWSYLLFYDLDKPSEADIKELIDVYEQFPISYIVYSTKNGVHAVGLTPLNRDALGFYSEVLHLAVPEYYSGETIRVSLKEGEKQELISFNFQYPVIGNLLHLYEKRFNFTCVPEFTKESYALVFEKYWSKKT